MEETPNKYSNTFLPLKCVGDIDGKEIEGLFFDSILLPMNTTYTKYEANGDGGFALVVTHDSDDYEKKIKLYDIFKYMKDEEGKLVTLLNVDRLLENCYDWHESIVSNPDISEFGYKYIIHGGVGTIGIYTIFLKGALYDDFIEYMHNMILNTLEAIQKAMKAINDRVMKGVETDG